mgnify:CR=1 FL=1
MKTLALYCRRCDTTWTEEMPEKLDMFLASLKVIGCPGCGASRKTKHEGRSAVLMGQVSERRHG